MPVYSFTPTISTLIYATGDIVAGKLTLPGAIAREVLLTHILIVDTDGEGVQFDFFFFNADLAGSYADQAAVALDAADTSKLVGVKSVLAGDYIAIGADKIAQAVLNNIVFKATQGGNLYVVPVVRGGPTYGAATDLRFEFGFIPL